MAVGALRAYAFSHAPVPCVHMQQRELRNLSSRIGTRSRLCTPLFYYTFHAHHDHRPALKMLVAATGYERVRARVCLKQRAQGIRG